MPASDFSQAEFTLANVQRDFSEWRQGRQRYALWALDVDCPVVCQRVAAAQDHLDGLLLDGYVRQPHITLSLCGFPSDAPQHADDFGEESLQAQVVALRRARLAPFALELGRLDSFSSAPYLRVQEAGGQIAALHGCLAAPDAPVSRGDYVPHVTVGLYAQAWPVPQVQRRLDSFAPPATALRLNVRGVHLLTYAAARIGGPLACAAMYDFASERLRWRVTPPWARAEVV